MKRTTIYLDSDIEVPLKLEAMRRKEPMAEVIRQALRSHLGKRPAKAPPGTGAFDSDHTDTADRAEELLAKSIRVRGRRSVRDLKARIRFADGYDYGALAPGARDDGK